MLRYLLYSYYLPKIYRWYRLISTFSGEEKNYELVFQVFGNFIIYRVSRLVSQLFTNNEEKVNCFRYVSLSGMHILRVQLKRFDCLVFRRLFRVHCKKGKRIDWCFNWLELFLLNQELIRRLPFFGDCNVGSESV